MAAQLLLLLLFSNIHAEVIISAGWFHRFFLDNKAAHSCSISRWSGEVKELLWNYSSYPYSPPRLPIHPHSGQYQVQCWSQDMLLLSRNSTLLVCDDQKMTELYLYLRDGQTVELPCDGVGPKQSVQWAYEDSRTYELSLIEDGTPSEFGLQLVKNKPSVLLTVDKRSLGVSYYCLDKQQLRCDLHSRFNVRLLPEFLLRSVGESLELNCSDGSGEQTHRWWILNSLWSERESLNSTLIFPSLRLEHSGSYTCDLGVSAPEHYRLYVCPEPEPPAVQLFTEGEELTLHCGDWNQSDGVRWFMRSNRTDGRVSRVYKYQRPDNMHLSNSSLVITDVSLQDSGHFWCVVRRGLLCVFSSETLVKLREPQVDHLLLRSVLLSAAVLVLMLCVVGVVWRGRRGEQLPTAVEEMQMSQLSPESDAQEEEAPV